MNDDEKLMRRRLEELSARAGARSHYTYSDFLTQSEQDMLLSLKLPIPCRLFGGYDGAERCIAIFGDADMFGYDESAPLCWLQIAPESQKFADSLTHRDFLGSLMALGLKREVLGDIILNENCGYLCCLEHIAPYIEDGLSEVRRTRVKVTRLTAAPEFAAREPSPSAIIVSSSRADAIIASVYNISRSECAALFSQKRVFINSRALENSSRNLKVGDVVSVRGRGRFIYDGESGETKKGRLKARVLIFK